MAAVVAAVLTATSSGGSSTGTPATASGKSAAATLKLAAYKSTSATGYKVAMTMNETVTGSSSGQVTVGITANGSFTPASRAGEMTMSMQVPAASGTQNLTMQMVLAGGTMYMQLPASIMSKLPNAKPWISMNFAQIGKAEGVPALSSLFKSSSSNFSNAGQYLDFLRATSDGSVKDLGESTLDGRQVTQYEADVDLAKLPDAVPAAQRSAVTQMLSELQSKGMNLGGEMPVDAWIDSSHLIRRLQMTYNLTAPGGVTVAANITENILDYGPQPAPTVPSAGETTNLLSLVHHG